MPFAPGDAVWPLAAAAAAPIMGLCIGRIGGKPSSCFPASVSGKDEVPEDSSCDGLHLLPGLVTLQSCLNASADSVSATEHEAAARADAYSALNESLSEDDITRAEARLGRALPDLLIALYREQNGGSVAALCIPRPGQKAPTCSEQTILPSGGFNDLVPAERLRTVWETVTDCAAPAPPGVASQVPDRARAMIVLAW